MNPAQRMFTGFVVALVIAVAVVLVVVHPFKKDTPPAEPRVGDFYAAPANVPSAPGKLIRSEAVFGGVPDGAQAWRILYTTTRKDGVPAIASALVVQQSGNSGSDHPVIAWAHGTSGYAQQCAPTEQMDASVLGAVPALDKALEKGWVMVATDYIGLGTKGPQPYLIGQGEGRAMLDSIRAAHELTDVSLGDKTVLWGHSQGGQAALWAGILAPTYAPDAHVIGVGTAAPASDLATLAKTLGTSQGGVVFASYLLESYAAAYRDVNFDHYVAAGARTGMHDLAELCLTDTQRIVTIGQTMPTGKPFYAVDPATGPLGDRLRENDPDGTISVPVFIGQGTEDALVIPSSQAAYVAKRCAAAGNGPLEYETFKGRQHIDLVASDSKFPDALYAWTADRFAGAKAPSTC